MASKDSKIYDDIREEMIEIITCCICTGEFVNPKMLPCIHSFCMDCLEKTGSQNNKKAGDLMPCPICRQLFEIPLQGFGGLRKNIFAERLVAMTKKLSSSSGSLSCDACLEEVKEGVNKEVALAQMFCNDCRQKLCTECCNQHRKFRLSKAHKLTTLAEQMGEDCLMESLVPSVCDRHSQVAMNIYCFDCKTVLCDGCLVEDHKSHASSLVETVADGFRKGIRGRVDSLLACESRARDKKKDLEKAKTDFLETVKDVEEKVISRKAAVGKLAEQHGLGLVQELVALKQGRMKEIQARTDDVDTYLTSLESFTLYCEKLLVQGSAGDICRAVNDLITRGDDLEQKNHRITEIQLDAFSVSYFNSNLEETLDGDCPNMIGTVAEGSGEKSRPKGKAEIILELRAKISSLDQEIKDEKSINCSLKTSADKLKQELMTCQQQLLDEQSANKTLTEEVLKTRTTTLTLETDFETVPEALHKDTRDLEKMNLGRDEERMKSKTLKARIKEPNGELTEENTTRSTLQHNIKQLKDKSDEIDYRSDPVLIQTIRTSLAKGENKPIQGITVLDKELFIISQKRSTVEVYDSLKFNFSRRFRLKELIDPSDIISSHKNNCIYIMDSKNSSWSNEILRVGPKGNLLLSWSTADDRGPLSVTEESDVILTVYKRNKLNEYSPLGQLIREIKLSSDDGLVHPRHAIKLTNGHFLVSHGVLGDHLIRVCLVDAGGKVMKAFSGEEGSTIVQLNSPVYLTIDGNGSILMADQLCSRILLLDSNLELKREIVSKDKHGLLYPRSLYFSESNGRLFVAEPSMVWVFDVK